MAWIHYDEMFLPYRLDENPDAKSVQSYPLFYSEIPDKLAEELEKAHSALYMVCEKIYELRESRGERNPI